MYDRHNQAVARAQLEQLERCIKGEKVMDASSEMLSEALRGGHVPETWTGKKLSQTVEQYLEIIKLRAEFYQVWSKLVIYALLKLNASGLLAVYVNNIRM